MVCRNCKRELPAIVNFCPYCGAPVSSGAESSQTSAPGGWSRRARRPNWNRKWRGNARDFWNRISQGIEIQELWAQFRAEARESYELYSKEVDWDYVHGAPRWKRHSRAASALFWAVLMKLSPSRRVLLLIALALVVLAFTRIVPFAWPLAIAALLSLIVLELADRVIMKRDLEIAREIQSWLVPKNPPEIPGVDIAFATRPANTVAGDYYDAFLRPGATDGSPPSAGVGAASEERLLLVVADVAGKSVPAALLMATFQASLRTLAAAPIPLYELVARLNEYACAHSLGGLRFTTAFFAELQLATLELNFINAGHNPPILRRPSGEIARLEDGGLPLGIQADARYDIGAVQLGRGDLLAVLTDGVVEAENERGEEYGESRLLELLKVNTAGSASGELRRLMTALDVFVGAARQHDDITCLLLRTP
jgi:sigma-B regulation protein RsbU (phosphoserine phosphatase)